MPDKSYDVFMSYSQKDKPLARKLVEALTKRGLRVWYDEDSIRVGDSFLSGMSEALEQSRYFVLIISPDYLSSTWQNFELGVALGRKWSSRQAAVVPVFVADVDKSSLPPPISHLQGINAKHLSPEKIADEVAEIVETERIA
jgi:predicted nucleotide-binding protein